MYRAKEARHGPDLAWRLLTLAGKEIRLTGRDT